MRLARNQIKCKRFQKNTFFHDCATNFATAADSCTRCFRRLLYKDSKALFAHLMRSVRGMNWF
jgi:hypothetical protein